MLKHLNAIRVKPPTWKVVGSSRKLNEIELNICRLAIVRGEMESFSIISEGRAVELTKDGKFSQQVANYSPASETCLEIWREQRKAQRAAEQAGK